MAEDEVADEDVQPREAELKVRLADEEVVIAGIGERDEVTDHAKRQVPAGVAVDAVVEQALAAVAVAKSAARLVGYALDGEVAELDRPARVELRLPLAVGSPSVPSDHLVVAERLATPANERLAELATGQRRDRLVVPAAVDTALERGEVGGGAGAQELLERGAGGGGEGLEGRGADWGASWLGNRLLLGSALSAG